MFRLVVIAVILSFSQNTFAQNNNPLSGYLVTNENDTLHGEIKYFLQEYNNCASVKFIDKRNSRSKFKTKDIKLY